MVLGGKEGRGFPNVERDGALVGTWVAGCGVVEGTSAGRQLEGPRRRERKSAFK